MYRVLIVDDDDAIRYTLKRSKIFAENGFTIEEEASDGKEALDKMFSGSFDLIITDIKMPGMSGLELLNELKTRKADVCVILLSTYTDFKFVKQGLRLGAFDYMTKPLTEDTLFEAIGRARQYLEEKYKSYNKGAAEEKDADVSSLVLYPKSYEERLLSLIIAASPKLVDEAESVYGDLAEMFDEDNSRICIILEKMLSNLNNDIFKSFPYLKSLEEKLFMSNITFMDSLTEIRDKFCEALNDMCGVIKKYELYHPENVIKKTCEYVITHVEDEIKLEVVANEILLSGNYLGKLFKKNTGSNFNDYVTKVKMEHAKKLIRSGEYKSYEISEKLGYSKPDYFSHLFKNYTGYTPLEFKKMRL